MPICRLFRADGRGRFLSRAEETLANDEEAAGRARQLAEEQQSRLEVWCAGRFVFETHRKGS
jgi:hypothetical protein